MASYTDYCKKEKIELKGSNIALGQVLCRLISNVKCSQKSEGGVRLKTYSGICLRDVPKKIPPWN